MDKTVDGERSPTRVGDISFEPRIINPVRLGDVVVFAADEMVREAHRVIVRNAPWAEVQVLSDPASVAAVRADGPLVLVVDDTALLMTDTDAVRAQNPDAIVVLLSFDEQVQCAPQHIAQERFPHTAKADLVFAVNRTGLTPELIIGSAVRAAEDLHNIRHQTHARRFVFLVVDDEPRWFSQFLPVLYRIIGQRAAVRVTRSYEETLQFLFGVSDEADIAEDYVKHGHGDDVVCLITDIFFPQGDQVDSQSGKDLIRLVSKLYLRIPIIIASKAEEAVDIPGVEFVLPKGDPGHLETLEITIEDYTGIGDFVVHDRDGREWHRIKDVLDLYRVLCEAEGEGPDAARLREILCELGNRDAYSTWLYMHSFRELGDELRPQKVERSQMIAVLKRHIEREMVRMQRTPLQVGDVKVFSLPELVTTLRRTPPSIVEDLANYDTFSSWLDRKGFSELANELRPIHGKGPELVDAIVELVEHWIPVYSAWSDDQVPTSERPPPVSF